MGAFSKSLRQEVATRYVRVSLAEPGAIETEFASHLRPEIAQQALQRFAGIERMKAEDIAGAIAYIVL